MLSTCRGAIKETAFRGISMSREQARALSTFKARISRSSISPVTDQTNIALPAQHIHIAQYNGARRIFKRR